MITSKNNKTFLIYTIVDNNDIPIYIGQTCNLKRRTQEHLLSANTNSNTNYLYNKLRKLIRLEEYKLKIIVIEDNLTGDIIDEREIYYIKYFKDLGYKLCNLTNGGQGTTGHIPEFTDEWKQKLSISAKKKCADPNYKNPFHNSMIILWMNKGLTEIEAKQKWKLQCQRTSERLKQNNPFKGKHHTEETKKIFAETAKRTFTGMKQSIEHINSRSKSHRETIANYTEEQKQKRIDFNTENRRKQLEKLRKYYKCTNLATGESHIIFGHKGELVKNLLSITGIKFNKQSIQNVIDNKWNNTKNWKFTLFQQSIQLCIVM
jgi:predicted GIY-YIG superfamily endonuclease